MRKRVALIGCGNLGRIHLKYLAQNKDIELKFVADKDPETLKKISDSYGIGAYDGYEGHLDDIDAALIAAPTEFHFSIARDLLEAGKDIFIEKPVTASIPDAYELKRIAAGKGLVVQVGHVERYNPVVRYAAGFIKEPMYIYGERLAPIAVSGRIKDVGVILDLMIHDIDLVLSFVNDEIEDIETVGFSAISPYDDMATTRIRFKKGCYVILTVSRMSLKKERKIRLFQRNMYLSLDLLGLKAKKVEGDISTMSLKPSIRRFRKKETLRLEQEDFFRSVAKRQSPAVGLDEGIKALEIAEKIKGALKLEESDRI